MKIEHLFIKSLNGYKELHLSFSTGVNIISGPNGIGKTTILNCIYASFKGLRDSLKLTPNISSKIGSWDITYTESGFFSEERSFHVTDDKEEKMYLPKNKTIRSNYIMYFNIYSRNLYNGLYGKNNLRRIKEWLYKNYYGDEISYQQFENAQLIKDCFWKLDKNVSYSRIIERNNYEAFNGKSSSMMGLIRGGKREMLEIDLLVETKQGEISFENLSSGYISCLSILLGIIRSIEMLNKETYVREFEGIILIDELDLHLHPEWQGKILKLLKWLVPYAQIIASTHSPHVIQGAEANEIIPLEINNQQVKVRKIPMSNEFGYQGWTIEEILTDVMGLINPRSDLFREVLKNFEHARKTNDENLLKESYLTLSKMIHPENPLLKLLSIQAGQLSVWEGLKYDSIN